MSRSSPFRSRFFTRCLLFTLLALVAARGSAAEAVSLGKLVPGKSLAAVVVNNPAQLNEKITKLMQSLQVPLEDVWSIVKLQTGAHSGIDEARSLILCVYPGEPLPTTVLLVPVSKYSDFLDNYAETKDEGEFKRVSFPFGEALVVARGDYAVIGMNAEDAEGLQAFLDDKTDAAALLQPHDAWLAAHDFALVGLQPGIKAAMAGGRGGLKQIQAGIPDSPQAEMLKAVFGIYDHLFAQLEEQGELFAVAGQLDEQSNLRVDSRTLFVKGGKLAGWIKQSDVAVPVGFKNLPDMPFVFAGELGLSPAVMKEFSASMLNLLPGVLKALPEGGEIDPDALKKMIEKAGALYTEVSGMSMSLATPKQGEGIYDGAMMVMAVKDAVGAMTKMSDLYGEMGKLLAKANGGKPVFEVEKTTIQSKATIKVSIPAAVLFPEGAANPNGLPGIQQMNAAMRNVLLGGKDSLSTFLCAADDQTLLITYNEAMLLDLLKEYKAPGSPLNKSPDVEPVLKLLPGKNQGTMLVSVTGYVNMTMNVVRAMMAAQPNGGPNMPQFPDFPAAPSVAVTVGFKGNMIETHSVFPHELMTITSQYIQAMR